MDERTISIMDEEMMARSLARMAHEIIEHNPALGDLAVVGIARRGAPLSRRLVDLIAQYTGTWVDWGSVEVSYYGDDMSVLAELPRLGQTNVLFPLRGRTVVLVDDMLYTGRTTRAAMDALIDIGKPKAIQLAVLIDCGHRELPITAQYVGKRVPTSSRERIEIQVKEIDNQDTVVLIKS